MECPHCRIHFHDNWNTFSIVRLAHEGYQLATTWQYRTADCPGCQVLTVELAVPAQGWIRVFPLGSTRPPAPIEVPGPIAADYREACLVLSLSPKASAALARRCLQNILNDRGYKDRDLAKQIDALLGEGDTTKAIPLSLRDTIDGIRNFGNFSAHPITDQTTLQVIDVDPHEAEWCLDTVEKMFQHFYVQPAQAKARKAALDAKLKAAGKPPSK